MASPCGTSGTNGLSFLLVSIYRTVPRAKEESVATSHFAVRSEVSVRENILAAGKHLYHVVGYDGTSVDAICREANANESEFVIYFGSREGLLLAIFEDGWQRLLLRLPKIQAVVSARVRLKELLRLAVEFFNQDPAFSELFVFEGRRLRGGEMMMLTPSYTDFTALLDSLVQIEVPEDESALVRSALMGAWEGVVRDLTLREHLGYPANFSGQQAEQFISRLVDRLMQPA
jgi:AcrR family transcriptional regulator